MNGLYPGQDDHHDAPPPRAPEKPEPRTADAGAILAFIREQHDGTTSTEIERRFGMSWRQVIAVVSDLYRDDLVRWTQRRRTVDAETGPELVREGVG